MKYLRAKLLAAIRREDMEGVRDLLNQGASPNPPTKSIFGRVFDYILGRGDWSPLTAAVHEGATQIVRMLLEAGADPQEDGILSTACWQGHTEIVELLVSFGACAGPRHLQIAVQRNQISIAEFLLEIGVEGEKAFGYAQRSWWRMHPKMLQLLERHGFDYTDEMKAAWADDYPKREKD